MTRRGRRFETYRGIRYAEPPVDNLRFQVMRQIFALGEHDKPVIQEVVRRSTANLRR